MSAENKDVKQAREASAPPPAVETKVPVPSLAAPQGLDLDLEELSGSLLVDEAPGRTAKVGDAPARRPRSAPPPLPWASSRPPPPPLTSSRPPPLPRGSLPKPTPPPRHEPPALSESEPPPTGVPDTATTDDLDALEVSLEVNAVNEAPDLSEAAGAVEAEAERADVSADVSPDVSADVSAAVEMSEAAHSDEVDGVDVTFGTEGPIEAPSTSVASSDVLATVANPTLVAALPGPLPPPQAPQLRLPQSRPFSSPLPDDIERTTLPHGVPSSAIAAPKGAHSAPPILPASGSTRPPHGRARPRRAVLAGLAAGGVGLVVAVVAAVRHHGATPSASMPAVAAATTAASTGAGVDAPGLAPGPSSARAAERSPSEPAAVAGGCTLAGAPRVLAPNAILGPGIEVRALGDEIALGFASGDHHAVLARVDPSSLSMSASTTKGWAGVVRRATPVLTRTGRVTLAVDVDRKGDSLRGRRTIQLDPPVQVGVAGAHLAWAPLRRRVAGKLWPLEGDDAVEAVRGVSSESTPSTAALAFRRADAVWIGQAESVDASLVPKKDLSRMGGHGSMVGAPAIAATAGVVLVAWAERQSSDEPWRLRWVRFKEGDSPGAEGTFAPPPGGRGEQAMSPGLAVVPGGRFLLVWTEGPPSAHEVRALTLSADGTPVGAPLSISGASTNAGQGQAAVAANGHGVIAFLEANANGFQLVATPIACAL